jgi:hypothetical protein
MPNLNGVPYHTHHALMGFRMPRFLLFALPIFLLAIWLSNVGAFNREKRAAQLTGGDWGFSARPALNPAYESAPIRVVSVTIAATKSGPEISRVFVKNQSSKTISSVKLAWWLINKQSPTIILGQGQTTPITLRGELPGSERKGIDFSPFPLVSFAEISKTLAKDGSLTGEFLVEVAVHEALYADKETWKIASAYKNGNIASSPAFMKASFSFPGHSIGDDESGCARQECEYFESGGTGGFRCKSISNSIYCTNCGDSCTTTLCGSPPAQCPPG